jgi:hypothetical protein
MTAFSKWKTIGYAAAIFVAGGVSGGALGIYETKSSLFAPQPEKEVALRIRNRLRVRLGLSDDQMAKIAPIIDSAARDLRSIRVESAQRINKVFEDSYAQVSALLTPEQRKKLDEMERERRTMMQNHWQDGHWHPPGPGGPGGPGGQRHGDGPDHDRPEPGPSAQ